MITIKDLNFHFGDKKVLEDINLNADSAKVIGIVGLNGSGKSTFFNILAGILKPASGVVLFMDRPMLRKDSAYLETTNFFYSRITGREYLHIFKQTNLHFDLNSLQQYMELPLDELIETYSTGMKKKLALLGILKQERSVYLFDEPFNGLDLETNKILELIILALKEKGKTVFLSSHIMEPLLSVCDAILILENRKFGRTFTRDRFNSIDNELFGLFIEKAREVISGSL